MKRHIFVITESLKRILFGRPLKSIEQKPKKCRYRRALPILSSANDDQLRRSDFIWLLLFLLGSY